MPCYLSREKRNPVPAPMFQIAHQVPSPPYTASRTYRAYLRNMSRSPRNPLRSIGPLCNPSVTKTEIHSHPIQPPPVPRNNSRIASRRGRCSGHLQMLLEKERDLLVIRRDSNGILASARLFERLCRDRQGRRRAYRTF